MSERDPTRGLGPRGDKPESAESVYGDQLSPGALAGDYVVQSVISAGGWGTVYLARHRVLDRMAAVKVLHRDLAKLPKQFKRFVREAKTVNKIGHPNIVDVYAFGRLPDGQPFFVMELLEGVTLDQQLDAGGRMAPVDCLEILEPLAAALAAAHEAGVVHRDLKASNVQVVKREGRWRVTLLDFGVAKYLDPDEDGASGITSTGTRLGTPDSMAPEQVRGLPTDARTDIYALGVMLYRMLTGRAPFRAESAVELERQHLEAQPVAPSALAPLPAGLDEVVLHCMAKEPAERFACVADVVDAFRAALDEPQSARSRSAVATRALAIYVEVRADAEIDDSTLVDDIARVLDLSEERLEESGYALAMQTGTAVLAVQPLDDELRQRHDALQLMQGLIEQLGRRDSKDPRVDVLMCLRVGSVLYEKGPSPRVVGGDLMRLSSWPISGRAAGVYATSEVAAGLDPGSVKLID